MSRDDGDLVGEGEDTLVNGGEELAGVAPREVGATDGASEEGVSGEEDGLIGEVKADAAFGVAWSVKDGASDAGDGNEFAVLEGVVWSMDGGGRDAEPACLDVHHFDQGQVVFVVEDWCAGEFLEAVGPGDVVDVGVGDDDLLDGEVVLGKQGHDAGDLVAGIDDDDLPSA